VQLIPASPYRNGSNAEQRLFRQLREVFYGEQHYIAFHSLNLPEHSGKRFSEIDFLILCPYGVYVLEVKGGGVKHHQGRWYTLDRHRNQHTIQHPFKQATSALHTIEQRFRSSPQLSAIRFSTGYGVVFPDVEWKQSGVEWDRTLICDRKNFRGCENWLRRLFTYWRGKSNDPPPLLSPDQIHTITQFLRPDFEQIEPLNSQLDYLKQQLVTLTEEQYRYLDIAAANPRVLCSGGAGTGKTFLAAELARRLAAEGCQVVFVCQSGWLLHYLEAHLPHENIMLSTLDGIVVKSRRAGIQRYDVLIVDEGQDLFTRKALEVMDRYIDGGLANGRWYLFHDSNHQSGLLGNIHAQEQGKVLEQLSCHLPVQLPLSINCRNSTPIIHRIESLLNVRIGQQGTGHGPAVKECVTLPASASVLLHQKIESLLQAGIGAGEISILSPLEFHSSSAAQLPQPMRSSLTQLDDYSVRSLPLNTISFAEIKHFKGLENEVVIVIDLPHPDQLNNTQGRVGHYVALTRARSLLVVIWRGVR
jgi:hypothetical protein